MVGGGGGGGGGALHNSSFYVKLIVRTCMCYRGHTFTRAPGP